MACIAILAQWVLTLTALLALSFSEYSHIIFSGYSHIIYVDPKKGTNNTACWTDNNPSLPCRNLSYALEYRNHSTQYLLQPGTHYLNSIASDRPFTDLQGVAITGMGSGYEVTKVSCFTPNAGLAFINVTNVAFENVTFSNCASLQNSTSRDYSSPEFELSLTQVGLYFSLCAGVSMERVHIQNSPRGSGVIIYNTIGTNSLIATSLTTVTPAPWPPQEEVESILSFPTVCRETRKTSLQVKLE